MDDTGHKKINSWVPIVRSDRQVKDSKGNYGDDWVFKAILPTQHCTMCSLDSSIPSPVSKNPKEMLQGNHCIFSVFPWTERTGTHIC